MQKGDFMSAAIRCKMNLTCSQTILKRAILKVKPEWKNSIHVGQAGEFTLYSETGDASWGTKERYDILVTGQGNPLVKSGKSQPVPATHDVGFKKNADGTWSMFCQGGKGVRSINGKLKQFVNSERARVLAEANGGRVLSDTEVRTSGGKRRKVKVRIGGKKIQELIKNVGV